MDTPETRLAQAREQIAGLTAAAEVNAAALAAKDARIAELEAAATVSASAVESLKAENAAFAAEVETLKAEARSAEQRAAEIVAMSCVEPVEIKPGANAGGSREELLMAFHSETDPRKKAAIFSKLNHSA